MELDRKSLDRLLALDDASFAALAGRIAEAAGADGLKTKHMLKNLDSLRGALAKMTPQEAEALLQSAGKEKSEEIYKILRGGY